MIQSFKITEVILLLSIGILQGQDYDFSKPDLIWPMPVALHEISGLSFAGQDEWLLAIQDEKGIVSGIDPATGLIKQSWTLTGKGDFEGIEVADSILYLLRSDGMLLQTPWQNGASGAVSSSQLIARKGIDLEGLGWDPILKKLLIAVKDDPSSLNNPTKGWLYFDPVSATLDSTIVGINKEEFSEIVKKQVKKSDKKRIMAWLKKTPDQFLLGPSGIAIHPSTSEIYMLSHRGKVLLVFDKKGLCTNSFALDPAIFPQPEGIAFNQQGDLYIASEGNKKKPGQIVIFRNKLKNQQNMEPDSH
jgi:uncharacterized protein YjiK